MLPANQVSFSLVQVLCSTEDSPPQAPGWVPQTPTCAAILTAFARAEPEPQNPLWQWVAGIPERRWPLGVQRFVVESHLRTFGFRKSS